jgi:ketopantoate reductase
MKICMFGAGAIGGLIGTRLALAGRAEVSALARGATLQSLRHNGWQLRSAGKLHSVAARASDDARELGVQDVVVIAVKGPAMAQVAASIAPLLGAATIVVPAINGVPWWFTQGLPGQAGTTMGRQAARRRWRAWTPTVASPPPSTSAASSAASSTLPPPRRSRGWSNTAWAAA